MSNPLPLRQPYEQPPTIGATLAATPHQYPNHVGNLCCNLTHNPNLRSNPCKCMSSRNQKKNERPRKVPLLENLALELEHLWQLLEQPLGSLRDARREHPIVAATVVAGGGCWLAVGR